MFLAHSFRLRDPWQCEPVEGGGVRWSRGFHRPTGLEPDDDLWLVISGLPEGAQVSLNGQPQTPPPGATHGQFQVTGLVAPSNRIEILIPFSLPCATGVSPVRTADGSCPADTGDTPVPPTTPFPYDARLGVIGHS